MNLYNYSLYIMAYKAKGKKSWKFFKDEDDRLKTTLKISDIYLWFSELCPDQDNYELIIFKKASQVVVTPTSSSWHGYVKEFFKISYRAEAKEYRRFVGEEKPRKYILTYSNQGIYKPKLVMDEKIDIPRVFDNLIDTFSYGHKHMGNSTYLIPFRIFRYEIGHNRKVKRAGLPDPFYLRMKLNYRNFSKINISEENLKKCWVVSGNLNVQYSMGWWYNNSDNIFTPTDFLKMYSFAVHRKYGNLSGYWFERRRPLNICGTYRCINPEHILLINREEYKEVKELLNKFKTLIDQSYLGDKYGETCSCTI